MSEFEKEMIMIQYELLQTQKERNNILKDAFIVHDGTIPALEKINNDFRKNIKWINQF